MKHFYIAAIAIFLAIPQDLPAQWTPSITMEGGSIIEDIIEYKDAIYISVSNAGVYRSEDNGTTWTATSVPPFPNFGRFVIIDDELLVLYSGKLFRTADGSTFTEATGIDAFINDVATDGTTLVVGGGAQFGIFISDDKGLNWTYVDDTKTQVDISAVAVRGSVILASGKTKPGVVFKSIDMGATWEEITVGSNNIVDLTYQGSTLFMNVAYDGLYRSNNDGTTWQKVRSESSYEAKISITPTHIHYIAGGKYASSANQGDSWTENLDGTTPGTSIECLFAGSSYVFAGTWGTGVFRKPLDNSAPWATCNEGLNFHLVLDLDIQGDEILAGTQWDFVKKSSDGGLTWTSFTDMGSGHDIVRLGNDIFVATSAIYRSSDGGATWQKKTNNLPTSGTATVLVAFKNKLYTEVDYEIYVSADRGESWVKKTEGYAGMARTAFVDDEDLYFGSFQGLFRLSSDEQHWEKIDIGIGETQSIGHIARLGTLLLVADQYTGVYKSPDDGETWTKINNNTVKSLAVRNNEIYAGGTSGPLYHSLDSGATWSDIRANLPSYGFVSTIGFTSKHVIVGIPYRGLWLRPIGEVAPPYFSFPSTLTDSTFLIDEPIVIRVDQPMETLDGTPITQDDIEDVITVTTADGTPVNYSAQLDEDLAEITVSIDGIEEDTDYRITIAPVANPEGLQTKAQSYLLRAVANVPPSVADIAVDMSENTTYQFTSSAFTAKYTDQEGSPLATIKVVSLPTHGTLKVDGTDVAVDAELSPGELSGLSYTPDADFVGTDQWEYSASDGKAYSNAALVKITIAPVTGIGEGISGNLTYYPNPVETILTIKNPNRHRIEWLTVTDMNGRSLLLPQEISVDVVTIDFTNVPSGIYIMAIRAEGQLHYSKVLRR